MIADEMVAFNRDQARAALGDAARARQLVAAGEARWPARYLAGFGLTIGVLFPVLGLAPPPVGVSVFMVVWVVVMTLMVRYAHRQPVTRRGQGRRIRITFGAWALIYSVAVIAGEALFAGDPAYRIPIAGILAAPLLAGACWAPRA